MPVSSQGKIICSGHPDYKPFMWQHEGTIVGAGSELIRTVFIELNKDFQIRFCGPRARVQEMVESNIIDFLVGACTNTKKKQGVLQTVSKKIWPRAQIKLQDLTHDPEIQVKMNQMLCTANRLCDDWLHRVQIDADTCLLYDPNMDDGAFASWQLAYEAMKNNNEISKK